MFWNVGKSDEIHHNIFTKLEIFHESTYSLPILNRKSIMYYSCCMRETIMKIQKEEENFFFFFDEFINKYEIILHL